MRDELRKYVNEWYLQYFTTTEQQLYFQFHITNICEARCKHCYFNEANIGQNRFVEYSLITQVIDQIVDYAKEKKLKPTIDFTGGDSLLHPQIDNILKYCHIKNVSTGLKCCSNKINNEIIAIFKENNVERVFLSLEGMKPINDFIRGKGDFDRTVNAIGLLKENNFYVRIKMTISKMNKNQIESLMLFLINNNFMIDSFMWARYWSKENKEHCLNKEEYAKILERQLEFLEEIYGQPSFFRYQQGKKEPRIRYDFKEHLWYPYLETKG